jgi:general nucleoside transport system permease protein
VTLAPRVFRYLMPVLVPLGAIVLALLVGAIMLAALGANPLQAYAALWQGAFGSRNAIADTLVKATPLLFVGVGICVAFRGGVINIGGEGQFIMGAMGATVLILNMPFLPSWAIIPLGMVMGLLGGALWGGIPGYLKARFNVNEILSTLMMNSIALQIMNHLLSGPWMDPVYIQNQSFIPETARFVAAADLPRWVPTRLHLGAAIAVVLAVVVWLLLWRTTMGYRIRAVGLNPKASKYAGIPVGRYSLLALSLSGALAGLGGAVQVMGVFHRMFTDGQLAGFTGAAGFNGIVVALFGGLHPLGAIPASILFGALLVGANQLQRVMQVPSALAITLNGLVVVFVVATQVWAKRAEMRAVLTQPEETRAPEALIAPTPRALPEEEG